VPRTSRTGGKVIKRRFPPEHYDRISTMLIAMVPYPMIERQLTLEWQKPKSYIANCIKQVHQDWAQAAAMVEDTRRHQIRHGFEALFMKASAAKDGNLATRIMHELGMLDGCYQQAQQVNVSHGGGVNVGISLGALGFKSPDEVQGRIEYLRGELAKRGPSALQGALGAGPPTIQGASQTVKPPSGQDRAIVDVADPDDTGDSSG